LPRKKAYLGAHSLQSFGKGTNENQDAFVASGGDNKFLACVFDGHGEKGKRISEFAKAAFSSNLFSHKEFHDDPKKALESAYHHTQDQIAKMHGPDAAQSGTTAVSCYQHRDRLLVANVGDSRAVLGRCDTARKGFRAVDLSSDQKPSRPDEKQRILAAGGKVDQMCFPVRNPAGGYSLIRGGPDRVMDSNGMGGLAVSRSLGDLSLRPYVSSQPEVFEKRLDNRDKFLVVGSDGVWDKLSSQEAVDIASRVKDPAHAAREITQQARQRWQSESRGMVSDDITAVVVRLEHDDDRSHAGGSSAETLARTAQNFRSRPSSGGDLRSRPSSGALAPLALGMREAGQHHHWHNSQLDRFNSSGHMVDRHGSPMNRLGISPVHTQRPQSNASEGFRRHKDQRDRQMSYSFSEPNLGASRGKRGGVSSQMTKPNHLLPPAGK
jgi:serine/threonine protein phosphatase PrpC